MKITLHKGERPFGGVPNDLLNDPSVSLKAKGLFAYMDCKSDMWNFTIRSMATQIKEGRDSIQLGLQELKDAGYLTYHKLNSGEGVYTLSYKPNPENPDKPNPENPMYGKSGRISNKDLHSKKDINIEGGKNSKTTDPKQPKKEKSKKETAVARNERRKAEFIEALKEEYKLHPQWDSNIIRRFWEYWTEYDTLHPEKGMRFEKHIPFNIGRRMGTFIAQQKKFNRENNDRL